MYESTKHECGGIAYVAGNELRQGWNLFCCARCGETFYKWITAEMMKKK